jgi:Phytanoyl-CoA dioxygenase (PhyH)
LRPAETSSENLIEVCRDAFWPVLAAYLGKHQPNRGLNRYFLPMPFSAGCFDARFFFDADVLSIVTSCMGERIVADQWGCDVPLPGSDYQDVHIDYRRPLFEEEPDLHLPPYMLLVSFGLCPITTSNGAIEIAPGTHRMSRDQAVHAVTSGDIPLHPISLEVGDVLIRHPWTLHRGTPNSTEIPRVLISVRYVRRWYADGSREINAIPVTLWNSLTLEQREIMRFPVGD